MRERIHRRAGLEADGRPLMWRRLGAGPEEEAPVDVDENLVELLCTQVIFTALRNYEVTLLLPTGSATLRQVLASSLGLRGWALADVPAQEPPVERTDV